ncbi:MAG: DNA polymerase III subunit alpha, partial [Chloroflexota bacterium]|nr:DNA polymerase III subunit alpha [Chloroflexota bacterium]
KYGSDHVAQIITFGTMLARAAIRDVGRVMNFSYSEVDRIAKAVPNQLGIKLEEALRIAPPLREMVAADPQVAKLIELARQVEGVARNASTHAAGVVISDEPLSALMPLQRATNSDSIMTQYEMHGVEALGLLKFDFLGLSNLTILRQAVDLIRQHRGEAIDIDHIPLDDKKTFDLLSSGETTGVFQLESPGMRRYVKDLRPTSVLDLAAMVALFRPGPMDNIPAYIRRKHGQEPVSYLHPLLEPYLAKTYGIFVYQEDIMSAAIALGGFTGPEADTLGYAIRKKKSSVLRAQKEKFVTQAAERGVAPHTIDAVFKAFEPFERYGFNKAHATCYGLIAYQTAYLKANYTVEYMTSVLTAVRDTADRVAAAIAECRRLGIEVRPPDVHLSGLHFTVEGEAIRFGLLAVKNVGHGAIESIIESREKEGDFRSLADFCARVDLRLGNKRVLESLIRVGALGRFGHPAQLLLALDEAMAAGQAQQRDRVSGQASLFDALDEGAPLERPLSHATQAPSRERLRWEKELLGLYLSDHPLGELATEIGTYVSAYSGDMGEELDQQRIVIGGVVTGVRRVLTKARATMAVATLEDLQGSLEVVVFPKVFEETGPTWAEDAILLVAGRVDHKGDETVLLADSVWTWEAARELGPEAFARHVAVSDRGRRGGRVAARGAPATTAVTAAPAPPVAVAPISRPVPVPVPVPVPMPVSEALAPPASMVRTMPRTSPLRGVTLEGTLEVAIDGPPPARAPASAPVAPAAPAADPAPVTPVRSSDRLAPAGELPGPMSLGSLASDAGEEAPWPEEVHDRLAAEETAVTAPIEAPVGQQVHVRFARAPQDSLVQALQTLRDVLREHPGDTPVVLHIPAGADERPMQLRGGVAYDAELLAVVRRRLGEGIAELRLG